MSKLLQAASNHAAPGTDSPYDVTVETPGSMLSSGGEGDSTVFLIDGDTLSDASGDKYRLAGAYAPETTKVLGQDDPWTVAGVDVPFTAGRRFAEVKQGEAGGPEVTEAVNEFLRAAAEAGNPYDRVIKTGDTAQDRDVIRMTNSQGQDLVTELYRHGIYKPTAQTEEKYVEAFRGGEAARDLNTFEGYTEVIQSLDDALAKNDLRDPTTGLPIYSLTAHDERQLQEGNQTNVHNLYAGVKYDDPNRTVDNMATNSLGTSARLGWEGLVSGAYGAAEMFGAGVGNETVEDWGRTGVQFQEELIQNMPQVANYNWQDVDSTWDGIQFLVNNTASSAAYLGLAAGGALLAAPAAALAGAVGTTALGAAAVGATASILPSATVYSGQVWNDMADGEKDAGWAVAGGVAAATLDRLGIAALFKPTQLMNQSGREAVTTWLVQNGKAANKAAAEKLLGANQRAVAGEFFAHMGKTAAEQVKSMVNRDAFVGQVAKGALLGAAGEGVTEAGQELVQYVAAKKAQGDQINQWEIEDRMRDAMIAGGTIGAGFGGAGGTADYASQRATITDFSNAEINRLNAIDALNRRLRERGEIPLSVTEILEQAKEGSSAKEYSDESVEADKKRKKGAKRQSRRGSFAQAAAKWQREGRGVVNAIKNIESIPDAIAKSIAGASKLVAAASTSAFSPQNLAKYETLRNIRALVGQTRGVLNSGASFEASQDFIYSKLAQQVYMPEVMAQFGLSTGAKTKDRENVSTMLRQFARDGWYQHMLDGKDIKDMPEELRPHAQALMNTAQRLEKMADDMWEEQNAAIREDGGEEFGYLKGWWWRHQNFDPAKVQKNKTAWYEFMRKNATDLSEAELNDFYDRITAGDASTLSDYFSHVRGIEYTPGHHMERSLNLSEKDGFNMFSSDDMFQNLDNAAKNAARFATNRRYFGAGGKKLDYMFDQLRAEGMPEKEIEEIAWYTKAIIDSSTGNFNRISNPRWAAVQKFATTWSIFAGLPLAALSSLPESVFIQIGLDKKEQSGAIMQAAKQIGKTFFASAEGSFKDAVNQNLVRATDVNGHAVPVPKEQQLLNDSGLFWTPSSAAQRLGVGEVNIAYKWYQDRFFAFTGISNITQAQRRASAAIFTDFVSNRLAELADAGDLTQGLTNRQQHVYQQLSEIGMNVELMVELWKDADNPTALLDYTGEQRGTTPDVAAAIDEQLQLGMYNFVNMRVQNPGAANRPLFFQDPHYALLTQFNGFVSTFTANIVPKLWNDYIKNGTPQMKYETFKLMLMMMAMGGASQYLKDMLKYGRPSPYLEDGQFLQRAIYSSGVVGQYERLIDQIVPIYGGSNYDKGVIDTVLGMALGEAGPTVRTIGSLTGATLDLTDAETRDRGLEKFLKQTPLLATVATGNPLVGVGAALAGQLGPQRKGLVSMLTGNGYQSGREYYDDL